jgi:hypothetical protein
MTEEAKIALLWSNFHRLSDEHKELIIQIAESIAKPEKSGPDKKPAVLNPIPQLRIK